MAKLFTLVSTLSKLGLINVLIVSLYRLACRFGVFVKLMPQKEPTPYNLFHVSFLESRQEAPNSLGASFVCSEAERLLGGELSFFSNQHYKVGSPPNWFMNPITGRNVSNYQQHWSRQGDFDSEGGDIKCIWEPSRFDWALIYARAYRLSHEERFLHALNDWGTDWKFRNPLNTGPNWKCGQETSIRLLQILLAAFLLNQHKEPAADLVRFVTEHASRIEPTIRYAIAQDNNHGSSEAAALFIGGAWLLSLKNSIADTRQATRWLQNGRRWLENRVDHLVEVDGSFSQYSVNYHRVFLDTICLAEFWRVLLQEDPFCDNFYSKAKAATKWLYIFTDEQSGDAPNIGGNDGARLFNLSSLSYRDYRPTVQLASRLFFNKLAYPPGEYNEPVNWLRLPFNNNDYKSLAYKKEPFLFKEGGYCYLAKEGLEIFLRFPQFKFRPSHADALHLDLWFKGKNICRDGGTYCYNTEKKWMNYFSGAKAHNTVEFDERDQMPRISRFLFGRWLKTNHMSPINEDAGKLEWSVGYKDYMGAEHSRNIMLEKDKIIIRDNVKGFNMQAVVRWRLIPGDWLLEGATCSSEHGVLSVSANVPIQRSELVQGYESRHYSEKNNIPVFEVEVREPAEIITEIILFS